MSHNRKIACLAVDDEPPALQIIEKYIHAIPTLHLTATCSNAVDALSVLQNDPIDLLFLDIQMPVILGTDFMRTLARPPKVIFTTAFRKFAVEGFELDAVDYLLKPISFERFLKAVNKVMKLNLQTTDTMPPVISKRAESEDVFIYLRTDRKNLKIHLNEILFIESLKDYIKVVTKEKAIISKLAISRFEEKLSTDSFLRIHRSFIVAINKVESFTPDLIHIGKYELPISRSYRHEVEKILKFK
jgi:DNA-binding LytR/AlgR family response regulator